MLKRCLLILMAMLSTSVAALAQTDAFPVTIRIDASKPIGQFKPVWRFFGADEPNYAYMKDGKKLLGELGRLGSSTAYFRTHNLLTSGDGTPALKWGSTNAYTEDADGKPRYDWTIVDRIFDSYLHAGMKPYVQVGFMPEALSINPQPYRHHWSPADPYDKIFTGWAYPPKDYGKWGELVFQWAHHCVQKYGKAEVESWYWEVWNEPNAPYWRGTPEEFHRLHDVAVDAIRRALPTARVGGCDTAGSGGKFMTAFLEHCINGRNYATGQQGTPLDFISFHAKGSPKFVDGHVRMGIANELREIDTAFKMIASYPQLKAKPIIIGECDPDGCAACQGPQLGYRNGTMYSSYTAASFARVIALADRHGVNLEGVLTWAFEFEDQPYFAGFRVLASNGIDLPVLNVFRMFGKMSGQRITATSTSETALEQILAAGVRDAPDVSALASRDETGNICVMTWHYHDDDVPGRDARLELVVSGLPTSSRRVRVTEFLIDAGHSNAYAAWKRMGSPRSPTPEQYAALERAGQLEQSEAPAIIDVMNSSATIHTQLARQAVALYVLEPVD